jgi:putative cell wall-binding protein
MDFPDALSAASYAAENGYPILFTKQDQVPKATKVALRSVDQTIVAGGEAVISEHAFSKLPDATRYAGDNRFGTAASIATDLNPSTHVFIATGMDFADALTGSVLAAKQDASMLLVKPNEIPAETAEAIKELKADSYTILGGESAVGNEVVEGLK